LGKDVETTEPSIFATRRGAIERKDGEANQEKAAVTVRLRRGYFKKKSERRRRDSKKQTKSTALEQDACRSEQEIWVILGRGRIEKNEGRKGHHSPLRESKNADLPTSIRKREKNKRRGEKERDAGTWEERKAFAGTLGGGLKKKKKEIETGQLIYRMEIDSASDLAPGAA